MGGGRYVHTSINITETGYWFVVLWYDIVGDIFW